MTKKEEEFNSILTELKLKSTLLQENLAKEESEKLVRLQIIAFFLLMLFLIVFITVLVIWLSLQLGCN